MCVVNIFYCSSCDIWSPIPVFRDSEDAPECRRYYRLVWDQKCDRVFDCKRQSQVNTPYAPTRKERLEMGEGKCTPECRLCHLVPFYRDCCDENKSGKLRFVSDSARPDAKNWRPPDCQWVVRKNPANAWKGL